MDVRDISFGCDDALKHNISLVFRRARFRCELGIGTMCTLRGSHPWHDMSDDTFWTANMSRILLWICNEQLRNIALRSVSELHFVEAHFVVDDRDGFITFYSGDW